MKTRTYAAVIFLGSLALASVITLYGSDSLRSRFGIKQPGLALASRDTVAASTCDISEKDAVHDDIFFISCGGIY